VNESGLLSSNNIIHNCHRFLALMMIFYDTGFRPGNRGPFPSGKGPKTIDAQTGFIGWDRREP
jgi:hypothetical protein